MIDADECGIVGGMTIGRGNRSTPRKPAPMPLCPPQIPHDLPWDRARAMAVAVESQGLTALAMARRSYPSYTSSGNHPLVASSKRISQKEGYGRRILLPS
jgi:hypothetical protein